jgi:hypothetical protein
MRYRYSGSQFGTTMSPYECDSDTGMTMREPSLEQVLLE